MISHPKDFSSLCKRELHLFQIFFTLYRLTTVSESRRYRGFLRKSEQWARKVMWQALNAPAIDLICSRDANLIEMKNSRPFARWAVGGGQWAWLSAEAEDKLKAGQESQL